MWKPDGGDPAPRWPRTVPLAWGEPGQTEQMPPVSPVPPTDPNPVPMYGRAAVPPHPVKRNTEELPVVILPARPAPLISMRVPNRVGLRRMMLGKGISFTGLLIAFIGWGVWAAAGRGKVAMPALGFAIVLLVAVGLFAVCRLLGRLILVYLFGRQRRSGRVSHTVVGLFLTACGGYYLSHTSWVIDGIDWLRALKE